MNKRQKEILQYQLEREKEVLGRLKKFYGQSLKDIDEKIKLLIADELTQSKIYQVEYQKALKGQISAILENLNSNQYQTISDYLKGCYEDGFIGTLYDLQGQGIPLIFPMNQEEIIEALMLDSKISEGLYTKLGNNVEDMKKHISSEISRGISTSSAYAEIARNIRSHANATVNQSMRIVRTEGNRIQARSALDASYKAKERGADVVKVWDSTLDNKTRPHHRQLDGQVKELDEDFEINGLTASAPGHFNKPSEDCNCRCKLLRIARWDLDGEFTKRNNETGELMRFDNVKSYEEFKKKYWDNTKKPVDILGESGIIKVRKTPQFDIENGTTKMKEAMKDSDYHEYLARLNNHDNLSVQKMYANYADNIESVKKMPAGGSYSPAKNSLDFSFPDIRHIENGKDKFSTLAHEYGHFFDKKCDYNGLNFKEIDAIYRNAPFSQKIFTKNASVSDEFLNAVRKDKLFLQENFTNEIKEVLKKHDASGGVQDAIDGLFGIRIKWGHGDKYYNRKYATIKISKEQKGLQKAYKELGFDASNQRKVAMICRNYETASEMWANIISAETLGGEMLEYVKKYLPNSYNAAINILKGVK